MLELADRRASSPLATRLEQKGVRRITVGRIAVQPEDQGSVGVAAARRVYGTAVESAETLWQTAQAGEQPDPNAARKIVDDLARASRRTARL